MVLSALRSLETSCFVSMNFGSCGEEGRAPDNAMTPCQMIQAYNSLPTGGMSSFRCQATRNSHGTGDILTKYLPRWNFISRLYVNNISVIQHWWKFHLALIHILKIWWLRNFARGIYQLCWYGMCQTVLWSGGEEKIYNQICYNECKFREKSFWKGCQIWS